MVAKLTSYFIAQPSEGHTDSKLMDTLKTVPRIDNYQALRTRFESWEREKLIQYALSITKAISERDEAKQAQAQDKAPNTLLQGMSIVQEIGESLSSTLSLNEVLTRLLELVNKALGVGDGSILLVEEPSKDLVFQTSLGSISQAIKPFRVPKGQGIAGVVAETGKPIRVDNAQKDNRHFKTIDQNTGFLTQSILCVPLTTRDKIIGVIEVFNKTTGPFSQEDEELLGAIANYAAISIENARLHESVIAERDRVIQAQEEASNRLQRDLHDGPTQLVAAMQMSIDFCKTALEKDLSRVGPELDEMMTLANRATHQMRTMLFELRPLELETRGLISAFETFVERRQRSEKTSLELQVKTDLPENEFPRLESKYERALFAITQEAVNNSFKYAKADNIFINIELKKDQCKLVIIDDGLGFELNRVTENYENRGSYGMINQKERADLLGTELKMKSAPGAGTEIIIEFKITPEMLRA